MYAIYLVVGTGNVNRDILERFSDCTVPLFSQLTTNKNSLSRGFMMAMSQKIVTFM